MKLLILIIIANIFIFAAKAEQVKSLLEIDPTITIKGLTNNSKPTAGDLIEVTFDLNEEFKTAEWEKLDQFKEKSFLVIGSGRVLKYEHHEGNFKFIITNYKPGIFIIDSFYLVKNSQKVAFTKKKEIEFSSVQSDNKEDDIFDPNALDIPAWLKAVLGLLSLLGTLLILNLFYKYFKNKNDNKNKLKGIPKKLTPIEELKEKLSEVKTKQYLSNQNYKRLYFLVSESFKNFLGKAFQFDADDKTTKELVDSVNDIGFNQEEIIKLKTFFEEMDFIKFTDNLPSVDSAATLASRIINFAEQLYRKVKNNFEEDLNNGI